MHHPLLLAASNDLFGSLGINWPALLLYSAAFLVVVAILGKWVYPPLVKALDQKIEELRETSKLKSQAAEDLESAQAEAKRIVTESHVTAREITLSAQTEALAIIEAAKQQSLHQSERIVAEGHEQLQRDLESARKDLARETRELVAGATASLIGTTNTPKADSELITQALKEAK